MTVNYPTINHIPFVEVIPDGDLVVIDKTKKVHEQITEETWVQGLYEVRKYANDIGGPECTTGLCAVGWLAAVYGPVNGFAKRAIIEDNLQCSLTIWNDVSEREFSDVKSIFTSLDI